MNFWQIFQLFSKPERDRGSHSAARRWFNALRTRAGLRRPRRALGASPGLHLDSLEVRQVLSSVSVISLHQDLIGFSGGAADSVLPESDLSDVARLVQSFRGQLAATIVSSIESPQTSKNEEVSGVQILSSDNGFTNLPDAAGADLVLVAPPEAVKRQAPINVNVMLDWGESDQPVTVVRWIGDDVQVTVQGLGNTSLATSGSEVAEGLIVFNTTEIFANLLPSRIVAVSFQKPAAVKDSAVRFDQGISDSSSLVKGADHKATVEKPVRTASELQSNVSRNIRAALQDPSNALDVVTDPVGLIDEVFLDGSLIAGDVSLHSVSNLGLSSGQQTSDVAELKKPGPAIRPQNGARSTSLATDLSIQTQAQASPGLVIPGAVPSLMRRSWNLVKSGKWIIGDMARRVLTRAQSGELADRESRANPSVEMPEDLNQVLDWLTWIMNPAEERPAAGITYQSGVHTETRPSPVPAKHDPISRDVQTNSWSEQSQARRQRDSFRQYSAWGGCCSVFYDELEMAPLPVSGSFPAELRYECQPRGPPAYHRDVDTASAKVDAPESLLERLRYSIAPRGPSLVTVEMQSPDFEFSSGPRVSPEELRYQAA